VLAAGSLVSLIAGASGSIERALFYGVSMSHDDLSGRTEGRTGGRTGSWKTAPDLDDVLSGFAEEVRVGRDEGAITEELLGSLTEAEQWELLVLLTRQELFRRADQRPG
jgi:hypothetical protein